MEYSIHYRQKDKGIQYIISYKVNNKWKQKSKQGFKGKKEAKAAADKELDKLKAEIKLNCNIDNELKNMTFKEFSTFHMEHLKLHMAATTIVAYETSLKAFSDINDLEISKIKNLHIQTCVDKLIKNGYKYSTIRLYFSKIKLFFNAAMNQYNMITCTPVNNIKISSSKENPTKVALTKTELNDLINKTKNRRYKLIFILAGTCGLRIGEIIGLTWDNIDFKNNIIKVTKQWKLVNDNNYNFGSLKSSNSYRNIPMSTQTIKALKEYKATNTTDIYNRVFLYNNTNSLSVNLKTYFKSRGLDITIHELRHTYATMLISNGVDFKTAAQLLGHDIKETMRTYSHVNDDMIKRATNIIENIF